MIQSTNLILGVPKFVIFLFGNFNYKCFFYGASCSIPSLYKNSIKTCKLWSTLNEIVRYLSIKEPDHLLQIWLDHLAVIGKRDFGQKLYSNDIIARSFEYFAKSRSTYSRFIQDYKLPSVKVLQRITSRCSRIDDEKFLHSIFSNLNSDQNKTIIMMDEVHVKCSLSYHGGAVFGKAVNQENAVANTILSVMIKCLYGGPELIYKAYPIRGLTSSFLENACQDTVEAIEKQENGEVLAIITDGHKINQKTFDKLKESEEKPWIKKDTSTFLLYDFVHIQKCVRNNWITEKTQELEFTFEGRTEVAKWSDIINLYELEKNNLVKLSKLDAVSVNPKPIERQRVSTVLKVFCDETVAALECHSQLDSNSVSGTVKFLKIFIKMWKIMNVKGVSEANRMRDPLREVIRSMDDERLLFLKEVACMAVKMKPKGSLRMKTFTHDTSKFLVHNCHAFIELAKHLLNEGYEYVIFGWFSTDPIEKNFGKWRQGTGGIYFITVQNVLEKLNINRAKLLLNLDKDLRGVTEECFHQCEQCDKPLTEKECDIIDNLEELEKSLSNDVMASLVFIGGYIQRKAGSFYEFDTMIYFDNYGLYLNTLDRGKLTKPHDTLMQWTIFCFILFTEISDVVCRKNIMKKFEAISEKYNFEASDKHNRTIANILINNKVHLLSPRSHKEASLKALKLSS